MEVSLYCGHADPDVFHHVLLSIYASILKFIDFDVTNRLDLIRTPEDKGIFSWHEIQVMLMLLSFTNLYC